MKSYFIELLVKRKLKRHDGRPLWKYELSYKEYEDLKTHLSLMDKYSFFNNSRGVDPRDITLFFANWWSYEYRGGSPSISDVYSSIGSCKINQRDFYKYAKKGANSLGISWIEKENRLFFRTLILQGGLPINHLVNPNNFGSYKRFLKRVLELNPSSIDEFMYENSITSILPPSCRNDTIYESCLKIVEAIWGGNDDYLSILNSNDNGSEILKELFEDKEGIDKKIKKSSRFKGIWVLEKEQTLCKIKLHFNFPKTIDKEDLCDLISESKDNLKSEYNLIANEELICRIRQNLKGDYKVFWVNKSVLWNGKEIKPDVYLTSIDSEKYKFLIRFIDSPKLSTPTLWVINSENKWILQKGKSCSQEDAFILFEDSWRTENYSNVEKIEILGQSLNWCKFSNTVTLITSKNENFVFNTNKTSFEWFIQEDKPRWVLSSTLPIVRNKPIITVYDDRGKPIKPQLFWRLKGRILWEEWEKTLSLPEGCIEYKIETNENEEQDIFYNIGNLNLIYNSESSHEANIEIDDINRFNFKIKTIKEEFEIVEIGNTISIKLTEEDKIPNSIRAMLSIIPKQNRNLHLEIVPPFHGVAILDQDGNKLQDKKILLFGHLAGFRVYTPINEHLYHIVFYNTSKRHIRIRKLIHKGITPLREYEEILRRLFRLSDVMNKNSSVTIELMDERDRLLNNFQVQNYNSTIHYEVVDTNIQIRIVGENSENLTLSAIPLDCVTEDIQCIPLSRKEEIFVLPSISVGNFIVFSNYDNSNYSILLPAFVSNITENTQTTTRDKYLRIEKIIFELESENCDGNNWKKVKKYFDICTKYELPFSTFDYLRASFSTPSLIAKMFCFLSEQNLNEDFIDKTCKVLEEELGFCFHWISMDNWFSAIKWLKEGLEDFYEENETNMVIFEIQKKIMELISNSEPVESFYKIAHFVSSGDIEEITGFHLNTEVRKLRSSLGERVLNELPTKTPKIANDFNDIFPITIDNYIVKILLKAPISIALSISGKCENIWKMDEDSEIIRRNIQYAQWISPSWYLKAIRYCLKQIKEQ